MLSILHDFCTLLSNKSIQIENEPLNDIVGNYEYQILDKENQDQICKINETLANQENVFISEYNEANHQYNFEFNFFIICFDQKIIIIREVDIDQLYQFISRNIESKIYFLSNDIRVKIIQLLNLQIPNSIENPYFTNEINKITENFVLIMNEVKNKNIELIKKLFNIISEAISGYLFHKSYNEHKNFDRVKNYFTFLKESNEKIYEKDIIKIKKLGDDYTNNVYLIYHTETQKLFAMKLYFYDEKSDELYKRELLNYYNINNPLFPKYYGKTSYFENKAIIIEYIEGKPLSKISEMNFNRENKLKSVFQIMIGLKYFYQHDYIYRDLKPDNIFIINKKGSICIIDFDRMISKNHESKTKDFQHKYVAPECFEDKKITTKADIYSLGVIINDIFYDEFQNDEPEEYKELHEMCERCTQYDPNKRPTLTEIINQFYIKYFSTITPINEIKTIQENAFLHDDKKFFKFWFSISEYDHRSSQFILGFEHYSAFHGKNKSQLIKFDSPVTGQKNLADQNKIGIVYIKIDVNKDIDKAIQYFTLSANQGMADAQFCLGLIYINENYKIKDINKSINYFTLAANQNVVYAQYNLGKIYLNDESNKDINKAIHYLKLAANQNFLLALYYLGDIYYEKDDYDNAIHYLTISADRNHSESQYLLGLIYCVGPVNYLNIDKAIYYLTLAANQNHSMSQLALGNIFYYGKYVQRNINKSLHYLTMSANQNNHHAQFYLGQKYLLGEYFPFDIDKSIHFLTLAANQNNQYAQYFLGKIFYDKQFVQQDINKSIYYLTLAANGNHSDAQYLLAGIFYEGKYVQQNIYNSIYYLTLAANQNNSFAQSILGDFFYEGKYVQRDINKSIHYLTLAANQNNSFAQYLLGDIFYYGKYVQQDINKSLYYLELAANRNYYKAQNFLGIILFQGKYVQRDINKSLYYLELAAKQDCTIAQYNLGNIYYHGIYVVRNIEKAIYYFKIAAYKNFIDSNCIVGLIYYKGIYIKKDIKKAMHYFSLGLDRKDPKSQFYVGLINYKQKNISEAIHFFELSAAHGYGSAQYYLGKIYYYDKYVKKNINKSMNYLKKSSDNENSKAQFLLGLIYLRGFDVESDIQKAIYYLTLASKQNNLISQFFLAIIYYHGVNVPCDIKKSIYYFKELSSFNCPIAKNYLGVIYKNGNGVVKSISNAIVYFEEAIKQNHSFSMYNLARIYYFGIDIEPDILKAIELLKNASENDLLIADLFLFFIFAHGDEKVKNQKNSLFYKNKFFEIGRLKYPINIFEFKLKVEYDITIVLLKQFFIEYDLLHYNDLFFDLLYSLNDGRFIFTRNEEKKLEKKNIDKFFYQGFYDIK